MSRLRARKQKRRMIAAGAVISSAVFALVVAIVTDDRSSGGSVPAAKFTPPESGQSSEIASSKAKPESAAAPIVGGSAVRVPEPAGGTAFIASDFDPIDPAPGDDEVIDAGGVAWFVPEAPTDTDDAETSAGKRQNAGVAGGGSQAQRAPAQNSGARRSNGPNAGFGGLGGGAGLGAGFAGGGPGPASLDESVFAGLAPASPTDADPAAFGGPSATPGKLDSCPPGEPVVSDCVATPVDPCPPGGLVVSPCFIGEFVSETTNSTTNMVASIEGTVLNVVPVFGPGESTEEGGSGDPESRTPPASRGLRALPTNGESTGGSGGGAAETTTVATEPVEINEEPETGGEETPQTPVTTVASVPGPAPFLLLGLGLALLVARRLR